MVVIKSESIPPSQAVENDGYRLRAESSFDQRNRSSRGARRGGSPFFNGLLACHCQRPADRLDPAPYNSRQSAWTREMAAADNGQPTARH
jgi:hypothetical protein